MHHSSPFQAVQDPVHMPTPQQPAHTNVWDYAEDCLQRTAEALHQARAANPSEISQGIAIARESHAQRMSADLLEITARIQGHAEERISPAIEDLGNKIAATLFPYLPVIPFGGKLIAPTAFYDTFDQIHKIASVLLSPVIFAEDKDAIGTASVNPVAALILAEEIHASVYKRFGIRPFVTTARLDYESWSFLNRKHFEL